MSIMPPIKLWHFFLAAALILALVFLFKSCDLYDKYSELKGEYTALKDEYSKQAQADKAKIAQGKERIKRLDEKIETLETVVLKREINIRSKDKKLAALFNELDGLKDKDKIIANLKEQISIWSEKFALAEFTIEDQERIIFTLKEKYQIQVSISDAWKASLEREIELRTLAEERLGLADRKLRMRSFYARAGGIASVSLGLILLYGLIK